MEKITIIGGGNGGFAAAADLTIRGHQVTLYDSPAFAAGLQPVIEQGGINLRTLPSNGLQGGFAKVYKVTTDIEEALAESDIVLVIAPAYAQANIAKTMAPHLRDGQIVALCPANFGGSLYFNKVLRDIGCTTKVQFAEFSCMMYATRKDGPAGSYVRGYKHNLGVAMFPNKNSDWAFERLKGIYPYIIRYNNIVETGMSNTNTTLHTSLMLLNAANIDNHEDRLFYAECVTQSLDHLIEATDKERMQVNVWPKMNVRSIPKITLDWYAYQGGEGETLSEIQHALVPKIFFESKMPKTLDYRYVTEDVPFGLIPIATFLEQMGFKHRAISALADILGYIMDRDFYKEARTMEELGIEKMNAEEFMQFLEEGN